MPKSALQGAVLQGLLKEQSGENEHCDNGAQQEESSKAVVPQSAGGEDVERPLGAGLAAEGRSSGLPLTQPICITSHKGRSDQVLSQLGFAPPANSDGCVNNWDRVC
jgi:hypothetical protein